MFEDQRISPETRHLPINRVHTPILCLGREVSDLFFTFFVCGCVPLQLLLATN